MSLAHLGSLIASLAERQNNPNALVRQIPTLLAAKAVLRLEMDKIVEVVSSLAALGDEINTDLIRLMFLRRIQLH